MNKNSLTRFGLFFDLLWCAISLILCLAYESRYLFTRLIPHDEGLLAYMAEAVRLGQISHLDFSDTYTGGLNYYYAWFFELFGSSFRSTRIALLIAFVPFLTAAFWISRSSVNRVAAAAVTILICLWSLPNYSSGLPSWYTLFISFFILWIIMRLTSEWYGLMVPALLGFMVALAILLKMTGVYLFAACGLWVLSSSYRAAHPPERQTLNWRSMWLFCFTALVACVYIVAHVVLLRQHLQASYVVIFLAPPCFCAVHLLRQAWLRSKSYDQFDLRLLLVYGSVAMASVLIGFGLMGFWRDFPQVWQDLFVDPQRRIHNAFYSLPTLANLSWGLVLFLPLFASTLTLAKRVTRTGSLAIGVLLVLALAVTAADSEFYFVFWKGLRLLVPLSILLVVYKTWHLADARLTAITFILAGLNLTQYPYSSGIYFIYIAPVLILLWLELSRNMSDSGKVILSCYGFALGIFALIGLNPGNIRTIGVKPDVVPEVELLSHPRAGIYTGAYYQGTYTKVIETIAKAQLLGFTNFYAGPDSPELYFLNNKPSKERTLYGFFESRDLDERIRQYVERDGVNLLVLNTHPEFSPRPQQKTVEWLQRKFINKESIGHFLLFWGPLYEQ